MNDLRKANRSRGKEMCLWPGHIALVRCPRSMDFEMHVYSIYSLESENGVHVACLGGKQENAWYRHRTTLNSFCRSFFIFITVY